MWAAFGEAPPSNPRRRPLLSTRRVSFELVQQRYRATGLREIASTGESLTEGHKGVFVSLSLLPAVLVVEYLNLRFLKWMNPLPYKHDEWEASNEVIGLENTPRAMALAATGMVDDTVALAWYLQELLAGRSAGVRRFGTHTVLCHGEIPLDVSEN